MSRSASVLRPTVTYEPAFGVMRPGLSSHKKVDNQAYWVILASRQDSAAHSAPAAIDVALIGTPVHYELRRVPSALNLLWRTRRRELRLVTELPCDLPDLVIVECWHPTVSLAPHDDETAGKIPRRPLDSSSPLRVVVEFGARGPSWAACFPDPAGPTASHSPVRLIAPPVGRQRVK